MRLTTHSPRHAAPTSHITPGPGHTSLRKPRLLASPGPAVSCPELVPPACDDWPCAGRLQGVARGRWCGAGWGAVLCVISSGDPGLGCVTLTPRTRGSEGCERILVLSSLIMLSKCSVHDVRDEVKCLHSSLQRCPSLDTSASVTTQAKTLSLFLCTV